MAIRNCWKCGKGQGLFLNAHQQSESLCDSCLVWCTPQALVAHGPISNNPSALKRRNGHLAPPLRAYPAEWQAAYSRSELAYDEEIRVLTPDSPQGLAASEALYHVLMS